MHNPPKNSYSFPDTKARNPNMASHTPERLEMQALEAFVFLVLRSATPPFMKKLQIPQAERMEHIPLDEILMSSDKVRFHLLQKKQQMLEHLMKLKHWWENNELLGNQSMEIRRRIKMCFTSELELVDTGCVFPLYRFLLQLIFSMKAGCAADSAEFPDHPKIHLELPRNDCYLYCEILNALIPFGIEELSTGHIVFGNSEPWILIIKNSPCLKKVHFRNNICEEILMTVGLFSKMLDTFILEQVFGRMMVSIDCLYKTFFSGLDYKTVSSVLNNQYSHNVRLSFPKLKWVDVGWKGHQGTIVAKYSLTEFVYNLLYFYPSITSVSCHTLRPFVLCVPSYVPEHCRCLKYNIKHIDFNGVILWIQNYFSELSDINDSQCGINRIISALKEVNHITIFHYGDLKTDVESVKEDVRFAEIWLPRLNFSSLTLHIPFTPPQELREGSIFSLYSSLFEKIGRHLTALHFHLYIEVDVKELCQTFLYFPSLKLLELRLHGGMFSGNEGDISLKTFKTLKSLSVTYTSFSGTLLINTFIERIIQASPSLINLELVLEHAPCEWLMMLAMNKLIAGIQTLRISFTAHPLVTWQSPRINGREVETSFYVPFIELLPNLEVLMLGLIPAEIFQQVKMIYHTSKLKVLPRGSPYIGYVVSDS